MAVVNVNLNNMLNVKDSRWLQLEVCREYQRSKCSRSDSECKFAHPPTNVEVQNGRVIACYDSIKGRCNREKPPCKYFHPPQHLKDQLLINGRNHLALKNALMLQMSMGPGQSVLPGPTIDYTEFRPVRCIPSSVHDWCEMSVRVNLVLFLFLLSNNIYSLGFLIIKIFSVKFISCSYS